MSKPKFNIDGTVMTYEQKRGLGVPSEPQTQTPAAAEEPATKPAARTGKQEPKEVVAFRIGARESAMLNAYIAMREPGVNRADIVTKALHAYYGEDFIRTFESLTRR